MVPVVILICTLFSFAKGYEIVYVVDSGENDMNSLSFGGIQFETEPLRSDYNQDEVELIRSLNEIARASRRGIFHFPDLHPKCSAANMTANCCITINTLKRTFDSCVEVGFNITDLKAYAGVSFNHHPIILKEIEVGKLCWGLPAPLSKISACLWVYHFELDPKRKEFEMCAVAEITPVFHVGLNCIKFENGTFSTNDSVKPEEKGIVNVDIVGGKLKFDIDRNSIGKSVKDWFKNKFEGIVHKFG